MDSDHPHPSASRPCCAHLAGGRLGHPRPFAGGCFSSRADRARSAGGCFSYRADAARAAATLAGTDTDRATFGATAARTTATLHVASWAALAADLGATTDTTAPEPTPGDSTAALALADLGATTDGTAPEHSPVGSTAGGRSSTLAGPNVTGDCFSCRGGRFLDRRLARLVHTHAGCPCFECSGLVGGAAGAAADATAADAAAVSRPARDGGATVDHASVGGEPGGQAVGGAWGC